MSDQSERSLVQIPAMVMVYDNGQKEWLFAGNSEGNSKVQIFHHPIHNTFRVVARKLLDHEIVINCAILKTTKYNRATETFHQWRDRQAVYGLSFMSPEDASTFGQSMENVLLSLNNVTPAVQTPVGQLFQKSGNDVGEAPPLDDGTGRSLYNRAQPQGIQTTQTKPSGPPPLRPPSQTPPSAPVVAKAPAAPPAQNPNYITPAPPVPTYNCPPAPSAGIAPPPPPAGGPPPPAPPPPPCGAPPPPAPSSTLAAVGSDDSGAPMSGLAAAIAGAKLKKVSKPAENGPSPVGASSSGGSTSISKAPPAMDMMSEMARKLQLIKAKAEKSDPEPFAPPSAPSTHSVGAGALPSSSTSTLQKSKVFPPRKASLVMTPQESYQSSTLPRDATPSPLSSQSGSDLEVFKQQIIAEMKLEMSRLKEELIEVIRTELGKC